MGQTKERVRNKLGKLLSANNGNNGGLTVRPELVEG